MRKFYVAKDDEGILRPGIAIFPADGHYGMSAKEEWDEITSKKKAMVKITLVICELTEVPA